MLTALQATPLAGVFDDRVRRWLMRLGEAVAIICLGVVAAQLVLSPWSASLRAPALMAADVGVRGQDVSADLSILSEIDAFHRVLVEDDAPAVVEDAPDTALNLRLTGVRGTEDPEAPPSATIMGPDDVERLFQIGDEVLNGVTLREVRIDRVLLTRVDGTVEALPFPERRRILQPVEGSAPAPRGASSATLTPVDGAATEPDSGAALAAGPADEARESETPGAGSDANASGSAEERPAIDVAALASVDPAALLAAIRVEPAQLADGRGGLALQPSGDAGVFETAGLRAGDVLLSVNGVSTATVEDAINAMITLESAQSLSFLVHRDGADIAVEATTD